MLHTYLTTSWHLRYPIIGAPMAYVGRGRLARAVSQAGGLGMIGIGSTESVDFLAREGAIARGTDQGRFGIGMHAWAIQRRPDLLDAAIEAHPFLISISFGSPAPYVERLHQYGIVLATQVNTRAEAIQAARDGVDLIVAQGTEAGGHVTGQVGALPLLQAVLDAVQVPDRAGSGNRHHSHPCVRCRARTCLASAVPRSRPVQSLYRSVARSHRCAPTGWRSASRAYRGNCQ
jgi:nitronate monooxygenase